MRSLPTILLILSFPAGAIAYVAAAQIIGDLPLSEGLRGFFVLFLPLFFAGLVMLPFLIPFFDRKAKADLAEYRRITGSSDAGSEPASNDPVGDQGRDPKTGPYDGEP